MFLGPLAQPKALLQSLSKASVSSYNFRTMSVGIYKETKQHEALILFADDNKKLFSSLKDSVLRDYLKLPLETDFQGKYKECHLVYTDSHPLTKRVLIVGLGKKNNASLQRLRVAAAAACAELQKKRISKNVGVLLPKVARTKPAEVVEALQVGSKVFQLRVTEMNSKEYLKKRNDPSEIQFHFITEEKREIRSLEKAEERGQIIANGVNFGRRLISLSPRHLQPQDLAKEAQKMASASPSKKKIKTTIWGEPELKKAKYGGILGVNQGSDTPPRLIILEYMNGRKGAKPLALVGKGVTFDSGGLSLKPPPMQEYMKYDMGGAATVLSAFKIAVDLQLKVNLVCIVASVENMPSGKATRPGDVLTMGNGKTVEVLNTDAEGRLILADALYHATTKYKCKGVIDAATLTGACAVAVGDSAAGLWGNDEALKKQLHKASKETHEHLWPFPDFMDFFGGQLKSEVADLRNIGRAREAGATLASLFLQEFIHNDTPWCHLDIAGCGWYEKPRDFVGIRGASGVPIRLLAKLIENYG